MGAIDYVGIEGPAKNIINAATGQAYGDNRGMLLNLSSGPPCLGSAPECQAKTISVRSITDGTSHTMIVGENSGRGVGDSNGDAPGGENFADLDGAWASKSNLAKLKLKVDVDGYSAINPPADVNWAEEEIFSDHPAGANVLMCDGSVHFLSDSTHYNIYFALCSRNGEEVIPGDALGD